MFVCAPFFTMPNTLKPKLTTRCILYLYFLPHFESFTTLLFYLFDFKSNFTTTNVFLLYFLLCTIVHFNPIRSMLVPLSSYCLLWSYLVHFNLLWFYSVHYIHFHLIRSTFLVTSNT